MPTDFDRWMDRVLDAAADNRRARAAAVFIADKLWPYVGALIKSDRTLTEVLANPTMADEISFGLSQDIPTLQWLADRNPHVGREVTQIQTAIKRLQDEKDSRTQPPHLDGCRNEGIFHGLVLALHIVTNGAACDEDECWAHERDLLTEIPLVST